MTLIELLSVTTFLNQMAIILIGMPDQIRLIRKFNSAEQVSTIKYAMVLLSNIQWFIFGLVGLNSWVVAGPQIPCAIFSTVIVAQCLYHQGKMRQPKIAEA